MASTHRCLSCLSRGCLGGSPFPRSSLSLSLSCSDNLQTSQMSSIIPTETQSLRHGRMNRKASLFSEKLMAESGTRRRFGSRLSFRICEDYEAKKTECKLVADRWLDSFLLHYYLKSIYFQEMVSVSAACMNISEKYCFYLRIMFFTCLFREVLRCVGYTPKATPFVASPQDA